MNLPIVTRLDGRPGCQNRGWTHEWRYGERHFKMTNLGGTYRTLDRIDGRCELDDGVLSEVGTTQVCRRSGSRD
jgi:hypothetical protein